MGERPFCSRLQLFAVVCSRFVVDLQIAGGKTGYTVSVLSTQQPQGAIMKHFRFIHTYIHTYITAVSAIFVPGC